MAMRKKKKNKIHVKSTGLKTSTDHKAFWWVKGIFCLCAAAGSSSLQAGK